jgi:hypothetical protein
MSRTLIALSKGLTIGTISNKLETLIGSADSMCILVL